MGAMLLQLINVKDLKRSRFDEVENYKKVGHVGSGGYGNCLLLQNRSNQALRVCKVQKRIKQVSEPLEIEILRDILPDHTRIVLLHEAITHAHPHHATLFRLLPRRRPFPTQCPLREFMGTCTGVIHLALFPPAFRGISVYTSRIRPSKSWSTTWLRMAANHPRGRQAGKYFPWSTNGRQSWLPVSGPW